MLSFLGRWGLEDGNPQTSDVCCDLKAETGSLYVATSQVPRVYCRGLTSYQCYGPVFLKSSSITYYT